MPKLSCGKDDGMLLLGKMCTTYRQLAWGHHGSCKIGLPSEIKILSKRRQSCTVDRSSHDRPVLQMKAFQTFTKLQLFEIITHPLSSLFVFHPQTLVFSIIQLLLFFQENHLEGFFPLKVNYYLYNVHCAQVNGIEILSLLSSLDLLSAFFFPSFSFNHPHINLEHCNKFNYHFSNWSLYKLLLLETLNKPS